MKLNLLSVLQRLFLFLLFVLPFIPLTVLGGNPEQEKRMFWVRFTDKGLQEIRFEELFDRKAIERRVSGNIEFEESDLPVNPQYLEVTGRHCTEIIGYSKWLNAAAVIAGEAEIEKIRTLSFVKGINEVITSDNPIRQGGVCSLEVSDSVQAKPATKRQERIIKAQQESMGLSAWEVAGISGKGIRIAVFDAGFPNVNTHPCFEHLRKNKQIIASRNFLKKSPDVYGRNFHGESVLSCIAGINEGKKLGVGTDAEFLLAITEYAIREPFREELFWLMAAEWADEKGAHIISSSLGYGYQRYFFRDMDGHSSLVAKAAGMAARKGILVVNSAGNEGTDKWKMIITPGDQDSVLTVGGIDPKNGYHIDFSSYGPNALGKVKPNLCAPGDVMAAKGKGIGNIQGTSFSCPLISGFSACLLQFKPELIGHPLEAINYLQEHCSLYPYFDYAHGYGVPDASFILSGKKNDTGAQFKLKDESARKKVKVLFDETSTSPYFIEEWEHALYLKYLDENSKVISYELYSVTPSTKEISAEYATFKDVYAVEVHYAGLTKKIILNHFSH